MRKINDYRPTIAEQNARSREIMSPHPTPSDKEAAARMMLAALQSVWLYEVEAPGTFLDGDARAIQTAIAAAETAGIKQEG